MRNGIEEQLPKSLPRDKVVLVVGPEGTYGLNNLKSQIQKMNRLGEWIRDEFRAAVPESIVTEKIGVILTMVSTKEGALVNMRRAARKLDICCPLQALTVGEVKEVLQLLDGRREKADQVTKKSGNGHLRPEAAAEAVRPVNGADAAAAPIERVAGAELSDERPKSPLSETKELLVMELGGLIDTLTNARNGIESLDVEVEADNARLHSELESLRAELEERKSQNSTAMSHIAEKNREIDRLNEELGRARTTAREAAAKASDFERQCRDVTAERDSLQAALDAIAGNLSKVRKS